jgi:hypothetical protein
MASAPVEIPDTEHELVIERVAAIDVAKVAGKVCAAWQDAPPVQPGVGCATSRSV